MGLSDRSYSQPPPSSFGSSIPPAVRWLLIINTVVFLVAFFLLRLGYDGLIFNLALNPAAVVQTFAVWQIFTYMFLHVGTIHWLFNAIGLFFFGGALERIWGTERFLRFYLISGVGAAIIGVVGAFLIGRSREFTLGASGAILGLVIAFGVLMAEQQVMFFFVPLKAKYLAMIAAALALLQAFDNPVAGIVHLGGGLTGFWLAFQASQYPTRGRSSFSRPNLIDRLRRRYKEWQIERAKRRFQVYLKKQHEDRDRFN